MGSSSWGCWHDPSFCYELAIRWKREPCVSVSILKEVLDSVMGYATNVTRYAGLIEAAISELAGVRNK